ncbi:MAG: hypothetical protein HKN76_06530 [Saprospiraceae bacterium]|nr:hypothetical protein [Saprospiraceae bacterium]
MKTLVNFRQNHCFFLKAIMVAVLAMPLMSCTDDPVEIPEPISSVDVMDGYPGNFKLLEDDCQSSPYTIEISRVNPEDQITPITDPMRVPSIYIANLANTGRNIVLGQWEGNGFEVRTQEVFNDQGIVKISAWLHLTDTDKLSLSYTMTTGLQTIMCSCTFEKVG